MKLRLTLKIDDLDSGAPACADRAYTLMVDDETIAAARSLGDAERDAVIRQMVHDGVYDALRIHADGIVGEIVGYAEKVEKVSKK